MTPHFKRLPGYYFLRRIKLFLLKVIPSNKKLFLLHPPHPEPQKMHLFTRRIRHNFKLWNQLMTTQSQIEWSQLHTVEQSTFALAIVEMREHLDFVNVIKNIIYHTQHLSPTLYVFHGKSNEKFVRKNLQGVTHVHYVALPMQSMDIEGYNQLLMSNHFWQKIDAEKILIFQTDTLCLRPLNQKFLTYDYIGAPWNAEEQKKLKLSVGNGGFSLRSKAAMLAVLDANISRQKQEPEDVFFARCLSQLNYHIADQTTAASFAVEAVYAETFGCHKSWFYLTQAEMKKLVKQVNN